MNKENFALKLDDEIILDSDARSKKHQIDFLDTCEWVNKVLVSHKHDNKRLFPYMTENFSATLATISFWPNSNFLENLSISSNVLAVYRHTHMMP